MSGVRQIIHRDRRVVFVTARLAPPWFNTSVVLHGDSPTHVVTWLGARKRLLCALQDAGFEIEELRTWFSLTGGRS